MGIAENASTADNDIVARLNERHEYERKHDAPADPLWLEAAAEIERLRGECDKLAGIVRGWHYLAVGPDEMGDYYTQKQLVKASEPYALPALVAITRKDTPHD